MARDLSCIAAVLNFTSTIFSKLGFNPSNRQLEVEKMNKVLDTFVEFRNEVRVNLLDKNFDKAQLLNSCDNVRTTLAQHGVHIRVITLFNINFETLLLRIKKCTVFLGPKRNV